MVENSRLMNMFTVSSLGSLILLSLVPCESINSTAICIKVGDHKSIYLVRGNARANPHKHWKIQRIATNICLKLSLTDFTSFLNNIDSFEK